MTLQVAGTTQYRVMIVVNYKTEGIWKEEVNQLPVIFSHFHFLVSLRAEVSTWDFANMKQGVG
jgi:hypothetical protein